MRLSLILPFALLCVAGTLPSTRPTSSPALAHAPRAAADSVREFRGVYETGFEISWFRPCAAPTGDDLWWVTLTDAALRQRDSLGKRLTGQPRSVYVRWRGTISPKMPAGTGHMGRGSRYLLVTEVLELRPADEGGCSTA